MARKKSSLGCFIAIGIIALVCLSGYLYETLTDSGDEEAPAATQLPAEAEPQEPAPSAAPAEIPEPAPPQTEFDLIEAQSQGLIEVKASITGSWKYIDLEIKSQSDNDLTITVSPGTIFEPESPGIQRLLAQQPDTFHLPKHRTISVDIYTISLDMWLDEPGENESYTLSPAPAVGELMDMVNLDAFQKESSRVCQFTVWALTDNPGCHEYAESHAIASGPSIKEIERMHALFQQAGIPTEGYQAVKEPFYVELIEASNRGLVTVDATGKGTISSIRVNLTSNSDNPLEISVLPGTIFGAQTADVQSMVVTTATMIPVYPRDITGDTVDAACANMALDMPGSSDGLLLSNQPPTEDLVKLLTLDDFEGATLRVQQFAIWTITDNPERDGYVPIVSSMFGIGPGSGPSDEEIDKIKILFAKAGISTDGYRALN